LPLHTWKLVLIYSKTKLSNLKPTTNNPIQSFTNIYHIRTDALVSYFIPRITLTWCHNAYSFQNQRPPISDHKFVLRNSFHVLYVHEKNSSRKTCDHQLEALALERSMHFDIELEWFVGWSMKWVRLVLLWYILMTDYIWLLIVWLEVGKFGFGLYKYNKLLRME
jgi:hypothetical protein